jgi:hypothetical protein
MLIKRGIWEKPGVTAFVDANHPLSRGLVGSWPFNEFDQRTAGTTPTATNFIAPRNLVYPADALTPNDHTTNSNQLYGRYQTLNDRGSPMLDMRSQGTGSLPYLKITGPSSRLKPSAEVTVFWAGMVFGDLTGGAQNNPSLASCTYTGTNSSPFVAYGIHRKSNNSGNVGNKDLFFLDDVGGTFHSITGSGSIAYNVFMSAAYTVRSGLQVAYVNGRSIGSNTNTGAITFSGTPIFSSGSSVFNAEIANIGNSAIHVWNRALTPDELLELHYSPFDFYRTPNLRTFFLPPNRRDFIYAPSGGIQFGGAAITLSNGTHSYVGSGGLQFGGGATYGRTVNRVYSPSGGVQFGGAARTVANLQIVERYQDLAETTVGTGGYTAGSGVLNVLSTAAPFKQTGLYSVCISDPTSTLAKALLTVRAVNSSTQFAVTSGGLDANCNAGDIVTAVLTERAIDQIRADLSRAGSFAVLPTIAKKGDVFHGDDGYYFRYDGTVWVPYAFTIAMRKPVSGDYAAVNAASSTLTDSTNGLFLQDSAAEEGLHLYKLAAPATPYTITARMGGVLELQSSKVPGFGLAFRESGSGKVETVMVSNNAGAGANPGAWIGVDYWTDATTYDSALAAALRLSLALDDVWLKIGDDGTNKSFSFSADGVNWLPLLSETRTTNFTADEVAWFIRTNGAAQTVGAVLRSWKVS